MKKRKILALASVLLLATSLSACGEDSMDSIDNPPIDLSSIESSSTSEVPSSDDVSSETGSSENNDSEGSSDTSSSSGPILQRGFSMNYTDGQKKITSDDFSGTYRINDGDTINFQHCNSYQFVFEFPINDTTEATSRTDSVKFIDKDKMLDLKEQNAIAKDLSIFLMNPVKKDEKVHQIDVIYSFSSTDEATEKHTFYYKIVDYDFADNMASKPTQESLDKYPAFKSMVSNIREHKFPLNGKYVGIENAEKLYQPEISEGLFDYDFIVENDAKNKELKYNTDYEQYIPSDCFIPNNIEFDQKLKLAITGVQIAFNKPSDVKPGRLTPAIMNAMSVYYLTLDVTDVLKSNHLGNITLYTVTPLEFKGLSSFRNDIVYSMLHTEYSLAAENYPDEFLTVNAGEAALKMIDINGALFACFKDKNYLYQAITVEVNTTNVDEILPDGVPEL